jgi:hypothetical protein
VRDTLFLTLKGTFQTDDLLLHHLHTKRRVSKPAPAGAETLAHPGLDPFNVLTKKSTVLVLTRTGEAGARFLFPAVGAVLERPRLGMGIKKPRHLAMAGFFALGELLVLFTLFRFSDNSLCYVSWTL